jgi:hypothetical protein
MRRLPMVLASAALCALMSIGCKQDLGERCEVNSDCSSGYCNKNVDFSSSEGGMCTTGPTTTPRDGSTADVRPPVDTAVASDARDTRADGTDSAPDVSADVPTDTAPSSTDAADAQAD